MTRIVTLLVSFALSSAVLADDTENRDPLEGFNRAVFSFNNTLDKALLKPVAKGYKAVSPDVVETGVANFFSNLGEVSNIVNDILQFKFGQAANDTGRLLVNTTIGVGGLFEVAEGMGLEKSDGEDFGQTLGKWGVGSGPYVMIPFIGPSTLRDAPSRFVDSFTNPVRYVEDVPTRNSLFAGNVVSDRAELLSVEELAKGDQYLFIRDAYLQRRDFLVEDGEVEDDFGSYEDF